MALLWLSLRVRWRRGWARSLTIALLIGGVGGFIFAAAASARRVATTYQTLIKEIDAPDVVVIPTCQPLSTGFGCAAPAEETTSAVVVERLEHLAVVEKVRLVEAASPYLVDADGSPLLANPADPTGCVDDDRSVFLLALGPGGPADQSMPFRLDGELPAPGSKGVVLALATATRSGLGVGDAVTVAGWCTGDGDARLIATPIVLSVTGVSVGPLDIEPPGSGIAIEPAFVDRAVVDTLFAAGSDPQRNSVVWLDPTASPAAIAEDFQPYEIVIDLRERAVAFDDELATDARLLWLLAGVSSGGAVLLLAPIVGRFVRDTGHDTAIMVALGMSRRRIAANAVASVGVLALVGAALAAVVAPAISAFLPRGFAVTIAPERPLWFDAFVAIIGAVLLVSAMVAMGAASAWQIGSHAQWRDPKVATHQGRFLGSSHMRPASHSGVLTAMGTPAGPRQPSPWPSFISLAVAGATCVASLTYLAGLAHLQQTPSLLGWNWDARVYFDDRPEEGPAIVAAIGQIDGVDVVTAGTTFPPLYLSVPDTDMVVYPWSFATGPEAIAPTMLSGRAPEGPDEVAINNIFADQSGLAAGDSVSFVRPSMLSMMVEAIEENAPDLDFADLGLEQVDRTFVIATYEITGFAVLPLERTQEFAQASFTLGGLAALVEFQEDEIETVREWLPDNLPDELQEIAAELFSNLDIEDRGVYLRISGDSVSTAEAIRRIDGVAEVIAPTPDEVLKFGIALNLDHTNRVPLTLAYVVSIAAAALLAYLLITAVRARRFEFAVMQALGMSSAGLRWSIAAQATATAIIPLLVAIPVGFAVGRQAWLAYARGLEVVPEAIIPWSAIALVAAGAIAIANVVVLIPAWAATNRSPAADLRAG